MLLAMIWGGSFLSIRVALDEITPLTSVAYRTTWAMLVLWAVIAVMRIPLPRDPKIWFSFLVMGLLNNVIPFTLMAWGQLHIESGLTSILNAFTAVVGVVIASLFFADERITLRKGIGVILGFFGVAVAIGLDNFRSFDLRSLAQLAVIGRHRSLCDCWRLGPQKVGRYATPNGCGGHVDWIDSNHVAAGLFH